MRKSSIKCRDEIKSITVFKRVTTHGQAQFVPGAEKLAGGRHSSSWLLLWTAQPRLPLNPILPSWMRHGLCSEIWSLLWLHSDLQQPWGLAQALIQSSPSPWWHLWWTVRKFMVGQVLLASLDFLSPFVTALLGLARSAQSYCGSESKGRGSGLQDLWWGVDDLPSDALGIFLWDLESSLWSGWQAPTPVAVHSPSPPSSTSRSPGQGFPTGLRPGSQPRAGESWPCVPRWWWALCFLGAPFSLPDWVMVNFRPPGLQSWHFLFPPTRRGASP